MAPTTYSLPEAVSGEYNDSLLGPIRYELDGGMHTPASEHEETVLEHLVDIGLAERRGDGNAFAGGLNRTAPHTDAAEDDAPKSRRRTRGGRTKENDAAAASTESAAGDSTGDANPEE